MAVQLVSRVANLGLGIIVTAVLVRMLGDAGFGQWSTILIVYPILTFFMDFGLLSVVVRESVADPEREGEWISALLVLQALMAIPSIIAALIILLLLHEGNAMLIAGLILLAQFPFALGGTFNAVFRIRMQNTVPMIMLTVNSVAWLIAVVIIKQSDGGMISLAVAMVAVNAATTLATLRIVLPMVKLCRPSRSTIRRLIAIGTPLGIAGVVTVAFAKIDQILVFSLAGSSDAGIYNAAYRLLDGSAFIPAAVLTTLAPVLAASWPGDPARLLRTSRRAIDYLAISSLGALAFVISAAGPIVELLFGPDFSASAAPLRVLTGAFVLICFGYLTDNLLLVLGKQRWMMLTAIAGLIVNVPVNVILIPIYGYMTAAWATLGTQGVILVLAGAAVRSELGFRSLLSPRLWRISLAAALLCIALAALESTGAPLSLLCVAAAALYPLLLFVLRGFDKREFEELILQRRMAV